jgi:hypothetical protein
MQLKTGWCVLRLFIGLEIKGKISFFAANTLLAGSIRVS